MILPPKVNQLPVVKVTWLDAWLDSDGEMSVADIEEKLKETVDVGLFIKKNRKVTIVASNYEDEDNLIRFVTQIPTSLVLKIERATGWETIFEKNGVKNEQARPISPSVPTQEPR